MRNVLIMVVCGLGLILAGCKKEQGAFDPTQDSGGVLASISGSDPCDKIVGVWRIDYSDGTESVLNIEKSDAVYVVRRNKTSRYVPPMQESFSGTCSKGIINTNTIVGNISYASTGDRVIFGGEYNRSSIQDGRERVAAKIEAKNAQLAEDEARQRQQYEGQRQTEIAAMVRNCFNLVQQCDQAAGFASSDPDVVKAALLRIGADPNNPPWSPAFMARTMANRMAKNPGNYHQYRPPERAMPAEEAADAAEAAAGFADKKM